MEEQEEMENKKFIVYVSGMGVTMTLGALGNAFTIAALIYATVKETRHFEGRHWITTTVFTFNLAVVELVYCLFSIAYLIYGGMLRNSADDGDTSKECEFFYLGLQTLALIDVWSVALIAVTRAFPVIK